MSLIRFRFSQDLREECCFLKIFVTMASSTLTSAQNSSFNLSQVELDALKRVFSYIDSKKDRRLDAQEIGDVLEKLLEKGMESSKTTPLDPELEAMLSKKSLDMMVWEVDEDLDGVVSWDEFLSMYLRCVGDKTGLEPRTLFNLVQFLMYDRDFGGSISVEQTLQILFVRWGRERLDAEIAEIFGDTASGGDGGRGSGGVDKSASGGFGGVEKRIGFGEYVGRVNARLTKLRSAKREVTKVGFGVKKND